MANPAERLSIAHVVPESWVLCPRLDVMGGEPELRSTPATSSPIPGEYGPSPRSVLLRRVWPSRLMAIPQKRGLPRPINPIRERERGERICARFRAEGTVPHFLHWAIPKGQKAASANVALPAMVLVNRSRGVHSFAHAANSRPEMFPAKQSSLHPLGPNSPIGRSGRVDVPAFPTACDEVFVQQYGGSTDYAFPAPRALIRACRKSRVLRSACWANHVSPRAAKFAVDQIWMGGEVRPVACPAAEPCSMAGYRRSACDAHHAGVAVLLLPGFRLELFLAGRASLGHDFKYSTSEQNEAYTW